MGVDKRTTHKPVGEIGLVGAVSILAGFILGAGIFVLPKRFSFDVDAPGLIEVTESHENPADHQYTVSIDDVTDELMACTCLSKAGSVDDATSQLHGEASMALSTPRT
ncbi:hypothetical protein [Haladaptatus sp. DYF46]|uniref:hypothetical protein n=1 Tax=Haladaptatus sp. DYF46 TaxID=2886041 RepID=UPI001E556C5E|nr:hypothetical protein [Haladaptatus sp. DYF46]